VKLERFAIDQTMTALEKPDREVESLSSPATLEMDTRLLRAAHESAAVYLSRLSNSQRGGELQSRSPPVPA